HQSAKDVANLASQCIRQLEKLHPPYPLDKENWCHIGITMYQEGERHNQIMDEAETALRSAQLQNNNNWSRFKKWNQIDEIRGSVNWRIIFETTLHDESVLLFGQPAYLLNNNQLDLLHTELTCRIHDPENGIVKASRYMSALKQVGFESQMD